jgi:diguanylate cyclase (GGDEF)-like protein
MTIAVDIAAAIPADQLTPEVRDMLGRLTDENGLLRAALAEMRARISDLEDSAEVDPLTGLANGRQFRAQLERVVSQSNRHGTPAALLLIDLTGLKAVNERYSQVAGDAALSHVARLLKELIRTSDIAARTGGATFALLLDHLDSESAIDTGERIARCIAAQPLDLGGTRVPLGATVAVAAILAGDKADAVVERAERNLARVREF